ncbi:MAG: sodium/glutamate symporter [Cyanophyceae cyanobacterium]
MFKLISVLFAMVILGGLVLLGRLAKQKIKIFQSLYLPESIIAGAIALLLGPGVFGAIAQLLGTPADGYFASGVFPEDIRTVWGQSSGVFINLVFAALFLGESLPNPKSIWRKTSPQVAFGQTLAWGQYAIGLFLGLVLLTPVFGANPIAGTLIEIGFEGGHGTAAGMAETLTNLGFEAGGDLALGLATVGIVTGVIAGTALAAWGRKAGYLPVEPQDVEEGDAMKQSWEMKPEPAEVLQKRRQLTQGLLVDPISLNFGFTAMAVAIGWLLLQFLTFIESLTWGAGGFELIGAIPLFPMALVGGIIVQVIMEKLGLEALINRQLQERIAGVSLDIVVITALASINLTVIGANLETFVVLAIAGIVWNILAFIYLAPRLLPLYWFERGIGDMGQSMGVTATGILLIRMVDPKSETGAFESFAYKQLFFEPIVGGGLFTAAAPQLVAQFGAPVILGLTAILAVFWIGFGLWNCGQIQKRLELEKS